jgi:rhodanese-related sulfurtransferase
MDKKQQRLMEQQDHIFSAMAAIIGGLAAPVRLRLIHFLSQAPLTVEVLAHKIDQSVANTSMHLRKMLSEKIVQVEALGQKRVYSLRPAVLKFWEQCQDFVQELDPTLVLEVKEIYGAIAWDKDLVQTLSMAQEQELVLLDIRPTEEVLEEFSAPYLIHIPGNLLEQKLKQLPKRKIILVICRGRFCAYSAHTVNLLRQQGYKAYRLDKSWFVLKQMIDQQLKT